MLGGSSISCSESPGLHCGRLSTALAALEQLQTLWLNYKGPEPQTPGALQLDALTALRTVALEGLVPESIQHEEGCELHITQHSYQCIEDAVWDTVLPHLRSVWVSDSGAVVTALPSCLLKAEKLTRASLRVHCFGTTAAPVPLDGALAQVDALVVQCKDLHATVPADVAWRSVSLAASNMLDLRFEDVASFREQDSDALLPPRHLTGMLPLSSCWALRWLQSLPASLEVRCLQGTSISGVIGHPRKEEPEWDGHFCESGGVSGICFPWDSRACTIQGDLYSCYCKACSICLEEDGILH